jgi:zinc transport system substrate-binding protein
MKKIIGLFLIALLALTLAGCGDNGVDEENVVFTTVYPMQYLLEAIGGNTITVKRVPGSTMHSHEDTISFSAKDQIEMMNSSLLFYVDGGVDTYIPNIKETVFDQGVVELVNVSEYVEYAQVCYSDHHDEAEHDETTTDGTCDENSLSDDPHFWLDPNRMLDALELVKDKLIVKFPENSDLYTNNYVVLKAALEKLNDDYQLMADAATKPIITTTLLFHYFHEAYDIEIISLTTSVHTTEVDPGSMISIIDSAILYEIHNIVFEMNTNFPAGEEVLEQLISQDSTASKVSLHGLGNLTTEEIEAGKTYMSIMYENLNILNQITK